MSRNPKNKLREPIPIPPPAPLPEPEEIDFAQILEEYSSGKIDLVVVLGPTASGKTRYAVIHAEYFPKSTNRAGTSTAESSAKTLSSRVPATRA